MMTTRLIIAIVSTALEEAAIAAIALWGLPKLGVEIPLAVLIVIMVAWAGFAVFTYRMGSRALRKKPVDGLPDVVGSWGEVVSRLEPEGMVKIRGETWKARSTGGKINVGEGIIVVRREGLELIVERAGRPKKPSS